MSIGILMIKYLAYRSFYWPYVCTREIPMFMKENLISIKESRKRIFRLWAISSVGLLLIVLVQSFLGKFNGEDVKIFSWLFPNVVPTLTLMLAIFKSDLSGSEDGSIDPTYYSSVLYGTIFYFFVLYMIIFIQPLTGDSLIELTQKSGIYLGPIQGVIAALIGLLFFKKK